MPDHLTDIGFKADNTAAGYEQIMALAREANGVEPATTNFALELLYELARVVALREQTTELELARLRHALRSRDKAMRQLARYIEGWALDVARSTQQADIPTAGPDNQR